MDGKIKNRLGLLSAEARGDGAGEIEDAERSSRPSKRGDLLIVAGASMMMASREVHDLRAEDV